MSKQYDEIKKEIEALEEEMYEAKKTPEGIKKFLTERYCEDTIDVHGSGWIYPPDESILMAYTQPQHEILPEVIYSKKVVERLTVFSETMVAVTVYAETYYALPDYQELSRKAGTVTMDPYSLYAARNNDKAPLAPGPGEGPALNPYRGRTTRVWIKEDGKWKLAIQQATRLNDRQRYDFRCPDDV